MAQYASQPKQYVSGETFYLLGRGVRLKVENSLRDAISSDGIYLHLCVKDTEDFAKKQKMVTRYLDEQCRSIFGEIILETYPVFQKYGVPMPQLRIRNMETRWGSCLAKKGIVTLNKRLLEAPRNCIESVSYTHLDVYKRQPLLKSTKLIPFNDNYTLFNQKKKEYSIMSTLSREYALSLSLINISCQARYPAQRRRGGRPLLHRPRRPRLRKRQAHLRKAQGDHPAPALRGAHPGRHRRKNHRPRNGQGLSLIHI